MKLQPEIRGRRQRAPLLSRAGLKLSLLLGLIACLGLAPAARANDQLVLGGRTLRIPRPGEPAPKAATLEAVRWPGSEIPVCWESLAPDEADQRRLVQQAVAASWEAKSGVRFIGWSACAPGESSVRITVGTGEWPRAIVGRGALGTAPSVWLNFHMAQHPGFTGCRGTETRCLQFTAVHEFGHVLGLIHEQDRPDTPQDCIQKLHSGERRDQPLPGLILLTAYDAGSVMNYCSEDGWDPQKPLALTPSDIAAARTLFPLPPEPPPAPPPAPEGGDPQTPLTATGGDGGAQKPETPPEAKPESKPEPKPPGEVSPEAREDARRRHLPIPVPD